MRRLSALVASAIAFSAGTSAQAVTTVVNAVLDRPFVYPGPEDRFPSFSTQFLTPRFPFDPGDTLDVTLTFRNGEPLNLGFLPSAARFTVFGGTGPTSTIYESTATFMFLNPVGAVNESTGPQSGVSDRNPSVGFTGLRQNQRGPLTFDGVRVIIQLDRSTRPPGTGMPVPETFSAFGLSFVNDVPEPGTWAMLIAGFGLTGAMARRQRRLA